MTQNDDRPADLILRNANVITVDEGLPRAAALAIRAGRLVAVGSESDASAFAGPQTKVVDLGGRTIIPGLIDNHTHALIAGAFLTGIGVQLAGVSSVEEIVTRVAERAKTTPPGEWIMTTAMPRVALEEGRMPNRWDLDRATVDHPVFVAQSGRNIIVNSLALGMAGIDRDTPDPTGIPDGAEGRIVRDENGEPTGHLIAGGGDVGKAQWWKLMGKPPRLFGFPHLGFDDAVRAIKLQMLEFNSVGITSFRDLGATEEEIDAYAHVASTGTATCRTEVTIGLPANYLTKDEIAPTLDRYERLHGLVIDDWMRIAGVKVIIQSDGWQSVSADKAQYIVLEANKRGWDLAFHAGSGDTDEVNSLLVEILELANKERDITTRRFSWEHGLGLFDPDLIRRIADLGVIISCQPTLSSAAAARTVSMGAEMDKLGLVKPGAVHKSEGFQRVIEEWGLPIKSWSDAGITVTLGSDWPASRPTIDNPLAQLDFACTQISSVGLLQPEEVVPLDSALRMATINGAYSMRVEDQIGSLAVGKLADLVVLDTDPYEVEAEGLSSVRVLATMVDGNVVFQAPNFELDM
ncbi:amidohydrolase family protein [Nocardia sp. NBC_00565]|uniref:amidohydrolase n=1 Tax=Nocardia sp. NBC_00565 TaxID=2975993 RepID=UPI002E8224CF|nr:amidohydrolase family protein [Nocardia sp. NBC_00565]WUC06598.1 amidohydrolase family protein [Nocardia sp. NBC_00565]